jgi:hypothetical protein
MKLKLNKIRLTGFQQYHTIPVINGLLLKLQGAWATLDPPLWDWPTPLAPSLRRPWAFSG